MSGPPPEAYGRVTDPERYRALHEVARQLIDELQQHFDIEVEPAPAMDAILASVGATFEQVVRLVANDEGAAPVTFALTDFPGVLVRAGSWQLFAYPSCGCDACDEDPAEVGEAMRMDVEAVTAGRISEEWDGERLHQSIAHADGSVSTGWSPADPTRVSYGKPQRHDWGPWPQRR